MQGSPALSTSNGPIWLLGIEYKAHAEGQDDANHTVCHSHIVRALIFCLLELTPSALQILDSVTEDFQSRIWMSYRRGFAPLGTQERHQKHHSGSCTCLCLCFLPKSKTVQCVQKAYCTLPRIIVPISHAHRGSLLTVQPRRRI